MSQYTPDLSQHQSYTTTQNTFLSRVFSWMSFALFLSGAIAFYISTNTELIRLVINNSYLFFGAIILELGLVLFISTSINRISYQTALISFLLYATLNGITLSFVFMIYTLGSVVAVFGVTAGTFSLMAMYGYYTKKDLTSFGSLLYMAVIGLIIASITNIFIASSAIYWVTTYAGVLIFVGLTAYDTQKLKRLGENIDDNSESGQKMAILGALSLYLDFINLFLYLLRILGRRR